MPRGEWEKDDRPKRRRVDIELTLSHEMVTDEDLRKFVASVLLDAKLRELEVHRSAILTSIHVRGMEFPIARLEELIIERRGIAMQEAVKSFRKVISTLEISR